MKLDKRLPKQSMGDVVDKMTILVRKLFFGEEDAVKELQYLVECMNDIEKDAGDLIVSIIRISFMNFEIWNRENEIRRGGDTVMEQEEIGKRAIEIRNFNRKRVHYKNEINRITGQGFREFKIKHRSQ